MQFLLEPPFPIILYTAGMIFLAWLLPRLGVYVPPRRGGLRDQHWG
jgi:hypothetical protein